MSIILLCGALYGLLRAAMLCALPVNRAANGLLAALILVLALYTAPYIIGYAGYYDAYPWLSFAPYNLTLAIGPLLYLYVRCLGAGGTGLPPRWQLHLAPALLQLLYYCAVFAQPLAFKNDWDARVHQPLVDRIETLALLLSLAFYWMAAWRRARLLAPAHGQAGWLRNLLAAGGLTVCLWFVLVASELATGGLSYFQRFPFYMWLGMLVAYLGTAGQQHGAVPFDAPEVPAPVAPAVAAVPAPVPADYAALGGAWRATIVERQLWRDPELTLASLSRQLGTNTTVLSRALNEGLGLNFNEVINRLRVDAVVARMAAGPTHAGPVLDLAMAEGFNSKASFNRAFKLYTGQTPTEYRKLLGQTGSVALSP